MNGNLRRFLAVTGVVFVFYSAALAEDINLEKIVVTPSRVEESSGEVARVVDVITSKEIERSGAETLADALTELTSVNISNYGGPGASKNVRMRGSTASQVLVMMDGRPLNNPRDGQVELTNIPLENIDRVEVMHGPGSSLYGSSAMGGTVNIITKNPPKDKPKLEMMSSFGTARTYFERMLQGARVGKLGYLISGEYQSSQGFRPNSEFNAKDANLKFDYELNEQNDVAFSSGFYKSRQGTPGPETTQDLNDKQDTLKRFFDFNYAFKPDEKTGLSAKIYQNYDRLEFMENDPGFAKDIHATTVRGFQAQFDRYMWERYRFVWGFDYVKNMNDSSVSAKHEYNVRATYLQNHLDLFQNLKVNFGARVDDYSNFGTQVNPNFDFLYTFNDDFKLHGLISRSFRAPTFNDLFWPSDAWSRGNPNLQPEKGVTGEFGADFKVGKFLSSGLTYYRSGYKQLIQWSDDGTGVWTPQNVNSALIQGVESNNTLYLNDNLEWEIDYTYLIAKDNKSHKFLVYQPKNKIDSYLRFKDHKGLVVELKGQFTGMRFDDAANSVKVKKFYTVGLSVSKKQGEHFTYFAYIDNLLNRKYHVIDDYPMPGFSFTGGVKAEF